MKIRKRLVRPLAFLAAVAATAVYTAAPTTASAYPSLCMRWSLNECSAYPVGTQEFDACYYPAFEACIAKYPDIEPPVPPPTHPPCC